MPKTKLKRYIWGTEIKLKRGSHNFHTIPQKGLSPKGGVPHGSAFCRVSASIRDYQTYQEHLQSPAKGLSLLCLLLGQYTRSTPVKVAYHSSKRFPLGKYKAHPTVQPQSRTTITSRNCSNCFPLGKYKDQPPATNLATHITPEF